MVDDDVPEDREREPASEPKRPLTQQDALIRTYAAKQEEQQAREQRILAERQAEISRQLDIHGITDPETRALATGFIASNVAATGHEFDRLEQRDLNAITGKSIGQAYEEEQRRRTAEAEEVARQSGDQPDRDRRPDEVARSQPAKEEEPERQREGDSGKEITESKAARIAKIRERGGQFEKEQSDKARETEQLREPGSRERE